MESWFLPGDWSKLETGQRISSVVQLVCRDAEGTQHLVCSYDRSMVKLWLCGVIPSGRVVMGTGLLVTSVCP